MRHTFQCFESVETWFIYYNDYVLIFDSNICLIIKLYLSTLQLKNYSL